MFLIFEDTDVNIVFLIAVDLLYTQNTVIDSGTELITDFC